ncbi:MAG: hypothetical protein AAFP76_05975 [Bacteroidota bacterium]
MTSNNFTSFRNLTLIAGFVMSCFTAQAQLDYHTASAVTGFDTSYVEDTTILTSNGSGTLKNGSAEIAIAPEIAKFIQGVRIEDHIQVSIQMKGESNGVYVAKKSDDSFVIKELQEGTSNADFSYTITLKNTK